MTSERPKDLDLSYLLGVLRRAALPVLLTALALSLLVYLYSRTRPAVYQATASIAALPNGGGNSVINTTLVTAPPLPPAVVARAMRSPEVVDRALTLLGQRVPDSAARRALEQQVRADLGQNDDQAVGLASDVNQDFVGVYEVSVRAATPPVAQAGANSFTQALLAWDRQRALGSVSLARQNLLQQRDDLTRRIAQAATPLDVRSLESLRGDVLQKLQQVEVLEQTVTGTLSALAGALLPVDPVEPRPLRNAALVFAATLFFGVLLAFALDQLRRRIRGPEDLRQFSVPVMATLPPLPARLTDPRALIREVGQGTFREQMDFVRVGLLATLVRPARTPLIVISSAQTGEGKSTVTAALASNLGLNGLRVLVVDADVYRRRQEQLWLSGGTGRPAPAPRPAGPGGSQLWSGVGERVDLAAPGNSRLDVDEVMNLIEHLRANYDVVLVDSPPVLRVADSLALAARMDGLLLVADAQVSRAQVERAVQEVGLLGVHLLGFVLNRFREPAGQGSYAYAPLQAERTGVLP
ncbi:hypothetical protein Dcar01_00101 [Deinococcus carri]|uniref:CobQ/CobB/MinD/ParA nucleotide binding domain-containing protein n=1 Tax=Deinococcus carri TaxID=1211323 RepID=A0ABP9W212_9DEIO